MQQQQQQLGGAQRVEYESTVTRARSRYMAVRIIAIGVQLFALN
jgi:hypothetical protein